MTKADNRFLILAAIAVAVGIWWYHCPTCRRATTTPVRLSSGKTYAVDSAYNDAGY